MDLRRRPALTAAVIGGGVCVVLAVVAAIEPPSFLTSFPENEPVEVPADTPAPPSPDVALTAPPRPTGAPEPAADLTGLLNVLGTVVVVLVGIALILAAVQAARVIAARAAARPIDDVVEAPPVSVREVHDVLRRAREQIALDEDANRAVIRCWESLEAIGASAGMPRGESETGAEYVRGILAAVSAPAAAATELSELYTRALFSADRLPDSAVDRARDCLSRLESALDGVQVSAHTDGPA